MPKCPFAKWQPITGSSGVHMGGPYKIVHHTTEGSTAKGALDTFRKHRSDPHFTVDATTIWQHIDTAEGARALRNADDGVQTNRDSAVQIELVGFAHLPKDREALANVARLCRWIESVHGVPKVWPAGVPRAAKNGKDPGGHNRDPKIWDAQSGHYGHSQVPENTHWDPGYTAAEAQFVLEATFDAAGALTSAALPVGAAKAAKVARAGKKAAGGKGRASAAVSTMPDHSFAPHPFDAYASDLKLASASPGIVLAGARSASVRRARAATAAGAAEAKVDGGSLLCFTEGLTAEERDDVLYSVLFAQRGASGAFDRFTETRQWYGKYTEILENLGWATDQIAFDRFEQAEGEFRMDKAALAVITAIATQNQLAVLQQAIGALEKLAESDGTISVFDFHSFLEGSGNFQIGAVQRLSNGGLSLALGAFYFRGVDERRRFLFFKWGAQAVNFWTAAQRMTLNRPFYAGRRQLVMARLAADSDDYIVDLPLGKR